jgi:hypothetical protein
MIMIWASKLQLLTQAAHKWFYSSSMVFLDSMASD